MRCGCKKIQYIKMREKVFSLIFEKSALFHLDFLQPVSFTLSHQESSGVQTITHIRMKCQIIVGLCVVAIAIALPRLKRQAYALPDGAELIVGPISTNFNCDGLRYGYYADVDNRCQIFHVCHPVTHADGNQETFQYSFFCGNQTVFNQLTLTCSFPEDAVPCNSARDFYYVNDNIGIEDALFLRDEDVARAQQLIQGKK